MSNKRFDYKGYLSKNKFTVNHENLSEWGKRATSKNDTYNGRLLNEASGDSKVLYTKGKDGKYIITPKTLSKFLDKNIKQRISPKIAKHFVKNFDYNAFNQFASDNPEDNIKDDSDTIMKDFEETYKNY